jgi:hypothetical protein
MKASRTYVFIFVPISPGGSARVSRAGCGVSPQQAFPLFPTRGRFRALRKVRDGEDAIASTRDACAAQPSLLDLVRR